LTTIRKLLIDNFFDSRKPKQWQTQRCRMLKIFECDGDGFDI